MPASDNSAPPVLHELEGDVMALLWERGECTVRDVLGALNERSGRERKYTTVMTTMARLDRKGLLVRRREGRSDVYRPAMSREQYARARAETEVGELLANYGEAALAHFVKQTDQLDPERREQLRRLAGHEPS